VDREPVHIRRCRPDDLDDVNSICLHTADSGRDGTALFRDPLLPGRVWAEPYVRFEPSLAFVAEDARGVGGYVVAALDTLDFERRLELSWWPAMREFYPDAQPGDEMSLWERYARHDIHHHFGVSPDVTERYPSHLHINLLPRMQRHGTGRRLISELVTALREHGSRGLHLLVGDSNPRAIGFYRHVGFTEVPASDAHIFVLDLAPVGDNPLAG
jgi:ribosomal protein S18 acetylase RimI-like enzyme